LKVSNIRFGHATNSSSVHSIIFNSDESDKDSDGRYGRERFVLSSKEAKSRYLAVLLREMLNELPANIGKLIIREWVGFIPHSEDYIDHQSIYRLPVDFTNHSIPDDIFWNDFKDYFLRDDVTIIGGNDNDEIETEGKVLNIIQDDSTKYIARKSGDWWTFFFPHSGHKVRFSFDDNAKSTRPYAPELVDIKITNQCNYGCEFCYQDSKPDGIHANSYHISKIAEMLGELKVFEIALGGGEPTLHPNLEYVVDTFNKYGITINLSTKNIYFLESKLAEKFGLIGVSVNDGKMVDKAFSIAEKNNIDISFHVPMGTISRSKFFSIYHLCERYNIPLTLLGFKEAGRGKEFKITNYDWLINDIREFREDNRIVRVGFDTLLINQFKDQLTDVDNRLYSDEGEFSCYIDAVDMKVGISSYAGELYNFDGKDEFIDRWCEKTKAYQAKG